MLVAKLSLILDGSDPAHFLLHPVKRLRVAPDNVARRLKQNFPRNHPVDVVKLDLPSNPRMPALPQLHSLFINAKHLAILTLTNVERPP